jgi:GAF domain-containing protein
MQQTHYDRILGILCSVLDAYSAVLFLPARTSSARKSEEADSVHAIASAFSLGDKIDFSAGIREGHGLVGWILRHAEPLLVANFDQLRNRLGYYIDSEEQYIKAFMGCSLPGGEGALCVDSKRQYSFSEKDQKMLHLFADLVARLRAEDSDGVEKQLTLRYYAALRTIYALRRRHSRWSDFLRHFLELMAEMTGFAYCALCTLDPGGESYSMEGESMPLLLKQGGTALSFPMTHGIVGWVFRNSARVCSDGLDNAPETPLVGAGTEMPPFQTVLALPVVIQRKTRGVLCLAHDLPMEIHELTRDFSGMAADHLALFLENLYVKCRLRDVYRENRPPDGSESAE